MKTAFCFDLDGTVTKQEILPLISKEVELHEEISLLTQLTLDGLIAFQTSFKLRVKLLSTIPISKVAEVVDKVILDENIVKFIHENKENCFIVTGNLDVWVKNIIETKLQCKFYSSVAEFQGDQLTGITKVLDKAHAIKEIRKDYDRIIAIGDSMNDCSMFQKADIGIAYGGTHNPVNSLVKLSNFVTFDAQSLTRTLQNYK
ncbi:HAD family hydrolase [Brumimicrobium salinarum]|uniref:phosphoserine phosphatase n=1 Tax=Brumimicrobium salinarum TaxID=2058658 RepID=A0A2I0R542_9FLAO|nr:HAD-IB family phosphatase [Brumimicrobium salinarum]PKR81711.1 HAD family hydrolase [Brumimicrobium salinarum]